MGNLLKSNPIIQRYRFSLMRPRQFGIYLAVYLIILLLLLFINAAARSSSEDLFAQILIFQIILVLWSAHNSSTAIRDEMVDKTYDFFRLLPLSAHQKTTGILVGKNLVAMLFMAVNFIFLIFFSFPSVGIVQLMQIILFLLCSVFFFNTTALLSSTMNINHRQKQTSQIVMLILMLFLLGPMIGGISALKNSCWGDEVTVPFYSLKIPVFLFLSGITLYFGVWSYWGTIRKFVKENECLFRRPWAIAFLIGFELILLGLCLPHLLRHGRRNDIEISCVFWGLTLTILLIISLASVRRFDAYWDKSIVLTGQTKSRFMRSMFFFSNTALAVVLFAIWSLFAVGFSIRADISAYSIRTMITLLFLSYLFLVLLIEVWALYRPDSEKIVILLVVIAAVYLILPLICAEVFEFKTLAFGSPLGLFSLIADRKPLPPNVYLVTLAYHVLLCAIPAYKIYQQWGRIRQVRERIDKNHVLEYSS